MKNRFISWFSMGIAIGVAAGLFMKNLSAGIALGIITGLLMAFTQTSFAKK